VYRILIEFKSSEQKPNQRTSSLFDAAGHLHDGGLVRFFQLLELHAAAENWQKQPTAQGREIEAVTKRFILDYEDSLQAGFNTKLSRIR
jgi:hypothetical protein